jgi:Kef-type K+ transport system membrane component KefB
MSKRSKIQKVIMGIATISYVAAIICGVVAGYLSDGTSSPLVATMMASVVFFAGTGIVLQVISSTSLPKLNAERQRS